MKEKHIFIEENIERSKVVTVNGTTYRTSGNILFSIEEDYYLAENSMLNKLENAVQRGILENGMQSLMKRLKS